MAAKAKTKRKTAPARATPAPLEAPRSPRQYRARVRMYRHGLGDCFLLSFPRPAGKPPCQVLIDCGALAVGQPAMVAMVEHIRDTVKGGRKAGKAQLDIVVATHEHKDHLSGFNQAREVFNNDFDINAVWMGWTENLTRAEVKKIKQARRQATRKLHAALASARFSAVSSEVGQRTSAGITALLGFSDADDATAKGSIADALEYLKARGEAEGKLEYLEPGAGPLSLPGVPDVRVWVLGPPRDPILLKGSEVTEQMKRDGVIYHLARTGSTGVEALSAATAQSGTPDADRYYPFAAEHRISKTSARAPGAGATANPYFERIRPFVERTYDARGQEWRRIDEDWLSAFGQLALDLDNDTNNTSLVLAFEFAKTGEVLLFVGDAQVGNWQSWANVEFSVPGQSKPMPAHDLLARTVFYKVGHHCSHNGTLKAGGLELMNRKGLVAFIPLREDVARKQGTNGWDMPAAPLLKALRQKTERRVVISDVTKSVPAEAIRAGVRETKLYVDYFLK